MGKYSEERKNRSKEEKDKEKAANAALVEEYGFCTMDGHREKIGNFRTEPPSLFRGRGEHPKQGMIKRRVMPEDVIINCSKDSTFPKPPPGHKWKKVQHDNTASQGSLTVGTSAVVTHTLGEPIVNEHTAVVPALAYYGKRSADAEAEADPYL